MSLSPPPSRERLPISTEGGKSYAEMPRTWIKWFTDIKELLAPVSTGGQILWSAISKAGSNLTEIETRKHADLQELDSDAATHLTKLVKTDLTDGGETILHKHRHNSQAGLQGGTTDDYYHLTGTQATDLTDGGATTLHKHDHAAQDNLNSATYSHLTAAQLNAALNQMSTALITGCTLSINADTTKFDVAAGTFRVMNNYTNPLASTYSEITYAGSTGNSVTNLATQDSTYVIIDSAGTITQSATKPSGADLRNKVLLGALVHTSHTFISSADSLTEVNGFDVSSSLTDISLAVGPINSGNIYSANATNTLRINKSAGTLTQTGINWKNNKQNPNVITCAASTGASFLITWRNGTGGWTTVLNSDITPGRYDDGTGGATQPNGLVSNNKWTLLRVHYLPNSQLTGIEYGQIVYNSEAEAEAAKSVATANNPALDSIPFRGWIIVRGAATNLNLTTDAIFLDAGKFGSETSGASTGSSTTNLQGAYNNSTQPQIVTDATLGAFQIKRGSAADTDVVFEVLNGAGTAVFQVTGLGVAGTGITLAQSRAVSTLRI